MLRFTALAGLAAHAIAELVDESNLVGKCFNWPDEGFAADNCIQSFYDDDPHYILQAGDSAVDFTLYDMHSAPYSLSDQLADKPVMLVFGMYTCPKFQLCSDSNTGNKELEYDLVDRYSDQFNFIHVYGLEPHPQSPDMGFDVGRVSEFCWSNYSQQNDYEGRKWIANKIQNDLHEDALFLLDGSVDSPCAYNPDDLEGDDYPAECINQVWCTYGLGARMAYLIDQDGTLQLVQDWFDVIEMEAAMLDLIGGSELAAAAPSLKDEYLGLGILAVAGIGGAVAFCVMVAVVLQRRETRGHYEAI